MFLRDCEGTVINNRFVVIFKYDMFAYVFFYVGSVYFFAGKLTLPQRSYIKIIFKDALYGDDAPFRFYFQPALITQDGV